MTLRSSIHSFHRSRAVRPARLIASAVLASAVLGGCASTTAVESSVADARLDDAPIKASVATLTVHGMSCPLCANNVDKSLLDVPGVSTVLTDMSTGRSLVTLDGRTPVSRRQLAEAVDRSGFSLVAVDVPVGEGD